MKPLPRGTMLILRGINNLLHEAPALAYAELQGFEPEVLDASGEAYAGSPQVNAALARVAKGGVIALYGFSGGGYNSVHIYADMTPAERGRIEQVVVLGAPGVSKGAFPGVPLVEVYNDKQIAHMDLPNAFLKLAVMKAEANDDPQSQAGKIEST